MKRTAWNRGAYLLLLLATTAMIGCGGKKDSTNAKGGASMAITTEDKFKAAAGADPSVTAEMGGSGFEKVAADSGWQTSVIPEDQFKYIANSNAKKGGSISLAFDEWPATFRSMGKDENTGETRFIYGLVYETLIGINPLTLEFLPSLATHWKVGADKQTYYFRIDPNARFSDGHPVTSEDVIATYKLGKDSAILDPYTNSFFDGFDPPEAISKYILKVRSKTLNWKNMFYFGGSISILPAHVIGTIGGAEYLKKYQYEMPPGSGPYLVADSTDIENGKSVTMTRRTNWWQGDYPVNKGQANIDKIKMLIIRDENLKYEKFRKGDFDFLLISKAQWWHTKFDFPEIKERGIIQKRKVYTDDAVGMGGLAFNTSRSPFNDIKVRKALTYLFNRDQILEKVLYNEYIPINSYYPNSPYENPNNPKQEYNPEKASKLLAEAGYTQRNGEGILMKNGKPFEINMPFPQSFSHIITPIQQEFQKGGIKVNLRVVDPTTLFKLVKERNFDMVFQSWGGLLYPNPISSFKSDLADKQNTNNITAFKDARADELMEQEQLTFDQPTRVRIMRELDSILVASHHYAMSWTSTFNRVAYWNKFGHPDFYLGKIADWRSAILLWWVDPELEAQLEKARQDQSVKMEVGPTDIKFWPDYNKANPATPDVNYTVAKEKDTGKSAKPTEQPTIK